MATKDPFGEYTVAVLYSFPSSPLSGIDPPINHTPVSLATSDSILMLSLADLWVSYSLPDT